MQPVDHFFSLIERERKQDNEQLKAAFVRLVAPVLGDSIARDLYVRARERIAGGTQNLQRLGSLVAFFTGEYDNSMPLESEDWDDIKETLEEASEFIELNTLTALMGDLLSRGKLR